MDNDQLLTEIQRLLEGMEQRTDAKFSNVDARLSLIDTRLESMNRELALQNELLSPFIRWSHQVEEEVIRLSVELATVKVRLEKLENPPTAA
jgi:hypothetical protein